MRTSVTLSEEIHRELQSYIQERFGAGRRVLSVIIEQAIKEFLEKQKEGKNENI